jgi:hypothetical protein
MYEFFLFWRNQRFADDVQENCARKILSPFILSPKNQHRIPLKHQVLFFQLHFHQNKNITIFFPPNISLLAPFFSTSFFFFNLSFYLSLERKLLFHQSPLRSRLRSATGSTEKSRPAKTTVAMLDGEHEGRLAMKSSRSAFVNCSLNVTMMRGVEWLSRPSTSAASIAHGEKNCRNSSVCLSAESR